MAKKRNTTGNSSSHVPKPKQQPKRKDVDKITEEFIDGILTRSDIEFGGGKTCPRWLFADCVDMAQKTILCVELRDHNEAFVVVNYSDVERGQIVEKSIDLIAVRSASALQNFVFSLRVAEVMLPTIPGRAP